MSNISTLGLDAATLASTFPKYVNHPKNRADFIVMCQGMLDDFSRCFTTKSGWKGAQTRAVEHIGEVLQTFQCAFTPKGSFTLTPIENTNFHIKMDVEFSCVIPDLCDSYMSFIQGLGMARDRAMKDWPLFRYILRRLAEQFTDDLKAYWWTAEYVAPVDGQPNCAEESFNGFGTIIRNDIASGQLVPVPVGDYDTTTVLDAVHALVDAIPSKFKKKKFKLIMDCKMLTAYKDAVDVRYGAASLAQIVNGERADEAYVRNRPNITIVGMDLSGSKRMVLAQKRDLWELVYDRKTPLLQIFPGIRDFKAYDEQGLWWGLGYSCPEAIIVNDVE